MGASLAELIALGKPIIVSFESDASLLQELQNGLKEIATPWSTAASMFRK